jgi:hypothetical protein
MAGCGGGASSKALDAAELHDAAAGPSNDGSGDASSSAADAGGAAGGATADARNDSPAPGQDGARDGADAPGNPDDASGGADVPVDVGDAGAGDTQAASQVCGDVGQRACPGNECRASCSMYGVCTLDRCVGEPSLMCDPESRTCGRAPGDRCGALGTRCCNYPVVPGGGRGGKPYCTAPGARCDLVQAVCVSIDTTTPRCGSGCGPIGVCTTEEVCRTCGVTGQPCCPDNRCWDRATCDTVKGMCGPAPGCQSNADCPPGVFCAGGCKL